MGKSMDSTTVAFAAAATLVALAFALSTLDRWLARRRRHDLAWTVSLFLFAAGAASFLAGAGLGWAPWSFRLFYLFGAILNVPFLALGTVYLLAGRRWGDAVGAGVCLLGAFAAGVVLSAPMSAPLAADQLPTGSKVFSWGPRALAGVGSGVAALVVFGGAAWSAWRLLRRGRHGMHRRLAAANVVIAGGTLLLSFKAPFAAIAGEANGFALALTAGIATIFAGFLLASSGSAAAAERSLSPGTSPPRHGANGSGPGGDAAARAGEPADALAH